MPDLAFLLVQLLLGYLSLGLMTLILLEYYGFIQKNIYLNREYFESKIQWRLEGEESYEEKIQIREDALLFCHLKLRVEVVLGFPPHLWRFIFEGGFPPIP